MKILLAALLVFALSLTLIPTAPAAALYMQAPLANAGPDRTINVNEALVLDGTGSTGGFDGLQTDGRHSIRWDFGYGGFTYEGGLTAPVAFPATGVFSVVLTVCNAGATCASDTTVVTVNAITEGAETVVGNTGNPITNGTNLKNAITASASVDNPVITLTAGVTYDFDGSAYSLPNRTGAGYLTIRSSAHASLPNGTSRVFPSDAANMAIITPGDKVGSPAENSAEAAFKAPMGATPGHHYRFLGIAFNAKFPTLSYNNPDAFIDLGAGGATNLNQLPHHIQIDRCAFNLTASTTAQFTRGVAVRANDVSIVNSYFMRHQRTSADVQAVWIGAGDRIAVINNFLSATTENMMSGGADIGIRITENTAQGTGNDSTHIKLAAGDSSVDDFYAGKGIYIASGTGASVPDVSNPGVTIVDYDGTTKIATVSPAWATVPNSTSVYRIGDYVPTNIVVRRNHMWKDPCWRNGATCYYGVNWNVKNIFEIKQGRQWSVQGNLFQNHWQEDQNWSVVITTKNQSGRQPWSTIQNLDFAHNKMLDVGNGFQLLTADFFWPTLGSARWLFRHNIVSGVGLLPAPGTLFKNFVLGADGGLVKGPLSMGEKISFVRNSTDQTGTNGTGRGFMFESTTKYRDLVIYGNIFQGEITQAGPTGQAALIAATGGGAGSFTFTKNGLYRPTGTLPVDNSTVSLVADVKYTDITGHNLALRNDSPFLLTGPAGGRAGAEVDTVNTLTTGTITGVWGSVSSTTICRWGTTPACQSQ